MGRCPRTMMPLKLLCTWPKMWSRRTRWLVVPRKFPFLHCREQPQGWSPAETTAAEGSDSDAGCSGELCQGKLNHRVSLFPGLNCSTLIPVVGIIYFLGSAVLGEQANPKVGGALSYFYCYRVGAWVGRGAATDDGNQVICTCVFLNPSPLGLLCATGSALSPARKVVNAANPLFEHWSEHKAHQPGPPQADGMYPGPSSVLPGEQGGKSSWHGCYVPSNCCLHDWVIGSQS